MRAAYLNSLSPEAAAAMRSSSAGVDDNSGSEAVQVKPPQEQHGRCGGASSAGSGVSPGHSGALTGDFVHSVMKCLEDETPSFGGWAGGGRVVLERGGGLQPLSCCFTLLMTAASRALQLSCVLCQLFPAAATTASKHKPGAPCTPHTLRLLFAVGLSVEMGVVTVVLLVLTGVLGAPAPAACVLWHAALPCCDCIRCIGGPVLQPSQRRGALLLLLRAGWSGLLFLVLASGLLYGTNVALVALLRHQCRGGRPHSFEPSFYWVSLILAPG